MISTQMINSIAGFLLMGTGATIIFLGIKRDDPSDQDKFIGVGILLISIGYFVLPF